MASKSLIPDPLEMSEETGRKGKKAKTQAPAPAKTKAKTTVKEDSKTTKAKTTSKESGQPRFGRRAGQPAASEFIRAYFLKGGTIEDCYAQIKKQMGKDTVRPGHVNGILQGCKRNGWGFKEVGDKIKLTRPSK